MAQKFITQNAGVLTEVEANTTSAGAGDSGKVVALDNTGRIASSMMPVGVAADTALIPATENLAAGDFVNVYNATGAKCRKADASTSGKEASGFVLAAVTSGDDATVYFEGTNTQVTGQTAGVVYLSATTAGASSSTAPTGAGEIVQRLGVATSATTINVECSQPIVLV